MGKVEYVLPRVNKRGFGLRLPIFIYKLIRRPHALVAVLILFVFILLGISSEVLAPYKPNEQSLRERLELPSAKHLLGTDELGRDELSRIMWGSRTSLTIAGLSISVAIAFGIPLGIIAGYFGGLADRTISALVDAMMTFPTILLALVIITIFGVGINTVILAIAIYSIPTFARLVRASTVQVKSTEYILSAHAIGVKNGRIIVKHILPNVIGPIVVQGSLSAGTAILTGAALSFLGIGVQSPTAEWGLMMTTARLYMRTAPHVILFPGLAIIMVVLSLNVLGDTLRDVLDPTSKI